MQKSLKNTQTVKLNHAENDSTYKYMIECLTTFFFLSRGEIKFKWISKKEKWQRRLISFFATSQECWHSRRAVGKEQTA